MDADSPPKLNKTGKVQFEDRFGNADESNVTAKLEVVISGNEVQVVGKLVTRFRTHHRREQFATDERRAGNIEGDRVAVLRFESRAALAEVETSFVDRTCWKALTSVS